MEYVFVKRLTDQEILNLCQRLIGRQPIVRRTVPETGETVESVGIKREHGPDVGERLILTFEPELTIDERKAIDAQFSRMGYIMLE